jgi:DNA-3-methyladenine glycosylase
MDGACGFEHGGREERENDGRGLVGIARAETRGTVGPVSLPVVSTAVLQRRPAVAQARWLLGKHLVRRHPDGRIEARVITETEAYDGERDLACHARVGRTPRTEVMYAAGGVWYVYLIYGVHEMLNLVVGPAEWPAAVLIRGLEGVSGPGRLTRALGIGRHLNGAAACDPVSGLWLEDRGVRVAPRTIAAGPRVGVEFAGPVWAAKPWRFSLTTVPRVGPVRRRGPTRG